jgi:hypothetical protein
LLKEVQAKVKGLQDLKKWLNGRAITARFTSVEDLRVKIEGALHDWRWRHPVGVAEQEPKHGRAGRDKESHDLGPSARGPVVLQAILKPRCRAVVVGDPGSEKSTFLRRVAHALAEHIARTRANRSAGQPPSAESAAWLVHYLGALARISHHHPRWAVVKSPGLAGQPLFDEPAHLAQIGPTLQSWLQDPHDPADVAQGLCRDLLDGLLHEGRDPRGIEGHR